MPAGPANRLTERLLSNSLRSFVKSGRKASAETDALKPDSKGSLEVPPILKKNQRLAEYLQSSIRHSLDYVR